MQSVHSHWRRHATAERPHIDDFSKDADLAIQNVHANKQSEQGHWGYTTPVWRPHSGVSHEDTAFVTQSGFLNTQSEHSHWGNEGHSRRPQDVRPPLENDNCQKTTFRNFRTRRGDLTDYDETKTAYTYGCPYHHNHWNHYGKQTSEHGHLGAGHASPVPTPPAGSWYRPIRRAVTPGNLERHWARATWPTHPPIHTTP